LDRLAIHSTPPRPCIIIGEPWQKVFLALRDNLGQYIKEHDWDYLQFVPDVDGAVLQINKHQSSKG
jgi:hypothetical protein